ncbi:MaoC family dehydratase [Motilibacter aurantiacus]|uniref:MaoC family dehydratase n=1 Tax=Motilibacter aurantiacus TaxID=2714955 RepID=UPI001408AB1B|nr:MaoC family dehydratase [Motilibacter aurantiacus]NHC44096.1 MaoC family dehydratase [Motilibacter aurantiacus]
MSRRPVAGVAVGDELPALTVRLGRGDLVRYAGASGDFNPIHWDEAAALAIGLPGVVAHGMLSMAQAARVLTDWAGDPGAVVEYSTRFTKPVVVPPGPETAELVVTGRVTELLDGGRVRVELTATSAGVKVLGVARAVLQLA